MFDCPVLGTPERAQFGLTASVGLLHENLSDSLVMQIEVFESLDFLNDTAWLAVNIFHDLI